MGYFSEKDIITMETSPFEGMDDLAESTTSENNIQTMNAPAPQTPPQSAEPLQTAPTAPASPAVPTQTAGSAAATPAATTTAPVAPAPGNTAEQSEEEKKKAHEEAEAKRKAEWEAKQAAKKAAEAEKLAHIASLSDQDAMMEAMKQLGEDAEKLTRRNMKECVSEHIQTMCLEDSAFARKVMHPKKSFVHCIWHINNKAAEFAQEEMKANGYKPEPGGNFPGSGVNGMYGCDVPDDLVYQWAVEYFNDPNAKEDEDKDDKFVPQPYRGTVVSSKSKTKDKKKDAKKAEAKKPDPKPTPKQEDSGQLDFFAEAS